MISLAQQFLFAETYLTRRTKEMLATYISVLNACPYCLDSHASFLHAHGGSEPLLRALFNADLNDPSISSKERALLSFAGKVNCESYKISPSDVARLTDAGWNEQQIAETVHIAALFACFNRVANAFGLPSQRLFDLSLDLIPAEESA
jgi:uncharacterized peroxidase-related enzyme